MANKTDLDKVLGGFSIFDRYHMELLVFIAMAFASNSIYCSNYVFVAEEIRYRCHDADFCNNTLCSGLNSTPCTKWVYDNPHSFVAEFQLAGEEWRRTLVGTIHSFGNMVGLLIVGPLSDRLGRKKAIILTGVSGGVLGLAKSFTPWYWVYIALEFLESAIGDICSPVYVLNIEIVATGKRVPYYLLCSMGYCFGNLILSLVAWAVPYWRTLLQVIYAPALLFFFYNYVIDESPRWLLSKGKKENAIKTIQKIADKNKLAVDKDVVSDLFCEDETDLNFIDVLKATFTSMTLIKRCLVCIVWWTTSTFVNYGMTINSVSLQGNKYINFALISMVDIPGNFIIMYILINFNRKYPLIVTFFIGAVLCIVQPFLPINLSWLSIVTYMSGKLMSSFYFTITYMYTSELFPTYTRNSMHALCSSIGRIGSIAAPQTPLLMVYWSGLPSIIFGASALLAGIVTFLIPDVVNRSLPDTVDQAKSLGKSETNQAMNNIVSSEVKDMHSELVAWPVSSTPVCCAGGRGLDSQPGQTPV